MTQRQRAVARLIVTRGYSALQIAEDLQISKATVKTHIRASQERTGMGSTLEVALAILHSKALLEEVYG